MLQCWRGAHVLLQVRSVGKRTSAHTHIHMYARVWARAQAHTRVRKGVCMHVLADICASQAFACAGEGVLAAVGFEILGSS